MLEGWPISRIWWPNCEAFSTLHASYTHSFPDEIYLCNLSAQHYLSFAFSFQNIKEWFTELSFGGGSKWPQVEILPDKNLFLHQIALIPHCFLVRKVSGAERWWTTDWRHGSFETTTFCAITKMRRLDSHAHHFSPWLCLQTRSYFSVLKQLLRERSVFCAAKQRRCQLSPSPLPHDHKPVSA